MKFKTKSRIATAFILIISGTAFLVGFLQESYASRVANMNDVLENRQVMLSRMQTHINYLTQLDLNNWELFDYYYWEAKMLDDTYVFLNSSLTSAERENYLHLISLNLELSNNYMNRLRLSDMCVHFLWSTDDYIIAGEGYYLSIAYDGQTSWSEFILDGVPIEIMTPFEFYGDFHCYEELQALPLNERPQNNYDYGYGYGEEEFIQITGWVPNMLEYFLGYELTEYNQEIITLRSEITALESLMSRIGLGVSLTAIAVILSAAMGNRIDQRKTDHNFDVLKEKEGIRVEKKRDLISVPVLIIATVVSLLGVILPFFSILLTI
jgi:hypothetical protein